MKIVSVDLSCLVANYQTIKRIVGSGVDVMAVVKADAYGHGMVQVATALGLAGCKSYGVGSVAEGVALRKAGLVGRILVCYDAKPHELGDILAYDLQLVLYDKDQVRSFSVALHAKKAKLAIHLKIDCGMGRLGFNRLETATIYESFVAAKVFDIVGVMSHFPLADSDIMLTRQQNNDFLSVVATLEKSGANLVAHIANSAAILNGRQFDYNMVRPGLALYGVFPGDDLKYQRYSLAPAMEVASEIIQVKDVLAHIGISYGFMQRTTRDSRLAVIPIGYQDGFSRSLSGEGQVLVRGQRARIIGRICMNMTIIDVTTIAGVKRGDRVIILGRQGNDEITATEIAKWQGSISWEVLCSLGGNITKNYR